VAYLLGKAYWGQGLASEAGRAIVRHGFERLGLSRLICMIDAGNQASIRVATSIGMRFEREVADDKGPFLLYAQERRPGR
jgi:RimJ/RimL family protein N-acetyltransferase